jgi:hypothetical protein
VPGQVIVSAPQGLTLTQLTDSAVQSTPDGSVALVGAVAYQVSGLSPGAAVDVTLQLPTGSNPTKVYKLIKGVSTDATADATIMGDTIVMHLIDGGFGDADGAANGVIVDPVVPVANATANYALSVAKEGTGFGSVTSSPAGITCGATCSTNYPSGASVTLSAAPSVGSVFSGWGGACSGTSRSCTVAMSAARAVIATFSAVAGATKYEESAAALDGWAAYSDASGSYRVSSVTGNTARFSFTGTAVQWLTKNGPAQGKASVTIDGVNRGIFDTYASSYHSSTQSFSGLTSATHTIVVKVLGTRNVAASAANVAVDGFTVGTATTQETSVKVQYDTWKGVASSSASGGTYRSSTTAGRTATFAFTGTGVDWITATGPGWGKAEVYIDGVDKGTVDLYASTNHYQTAEPYSGLPRGSHTIIVKTLGKKNSAAKADAVSIDAFLVH